MSAIPPRILNYLKGGRLHPAVILAGPQKEAKWDLAKQIAKFFLCTEKKGALPFCDQCNRCRRIDKEIHPDVLLYRMPEEDSIKIDTVRDFCHQMEIGPIEGQLKLCLVDECHRMNAAAANAFLKTLEEPGEGRFFWLLTSQPGALLPTILSRCLKFNLAFEAVEDTSLNSWEPLFLEFLKDRAPQRLTAKIDSKEKASEFVQYLQRRLHHTALSEPEMQAESVATYEELVELEGRLRSNANYGLMLESFLARTF